MKMYGVGIAVIATMMSWNVAHAQRLAPGSSLAGYQCYGLNAAGLKLTPEELWAAKGLPSVFEGPSDSSKRLGVVSGIVYVTWPLEKANGFVRIVRFGGQLAWVSAKVIRPLYREPGSRGGCTLAWHGNLIQYTLDPGAKGWLFRDGHDIPEDKMIRH